jgi:hypothetical protein
MAGGVEAVHGERADLDTGCVGEGTKEMLG